MLEIVARRSWRHVSGFSFKGLWAHFWVHTIFFHKIWLKRYKKVKINQIIILDHTEHTKAKLFQIPTIKFAQKYEKLLQLSIFIHPVSYIWESNSDMVSYTGINLPETTEHAEHHQIQHNELTQLQVLSCPSYWGVKDHSHAQFFDHTFYTFSNQYNGYECENLGYMKAWEHRSSVRAKRLEAPSSLRQSHSNMGWLGTSHSPTSTPASLCEKNKTCIL